MSILSFFSILYLYLKQFFIITDRRIKIESIILDTGHGYDHYWWNSLDNDKLKDELDLSSGFTIKCQNQQNIYGTGNASIIIVNELISQPLSVVKKFVDI